MLSDDETPPTPGRVLVLLCTYREAENLPVMLQLLREHLPAADVLVVDDNSPDGTADYIRQQQTEHPGLHLVVRPGKFGLGTAIRDGMQWCLDRDYDFLINLDADLSHDPAAAPSLLDACQDPELTQVDLAVGSRYVPGGASPGLAWHRQILSRALNIYATKLLRLPVHDCSGSFRCYRASTLSKVDLDAMRCEGYGFLEEVLVALCRSGANIVELPIVFGERTRGQSKLSARDALGVFKVVHRLAWSSGQ